MNRPLPLGVDVQYAPEIDSMRVLHNGRVLFVLTDPDVGLIFQLINVLKSERDMALDRVEGLESLMTLKKGLTDGISR